MKRKLHTTPTHARTPARRVNRTKAPARLALLLVAALAVAYAAVTTNSSAQTRKRPARTQPPQATLLRGDTVQESAREASAGAPKRNAPERPSAGKGAGRRARQREEDGDLGEPRGRGNGGGRGDERAEGRAREMRLRRGRPFRGDVRQLPQAPPEKVERPEREVPEPNPTLYVPPGGKAPAEGAKSAPEAAGAAAPSAPAAQAPAPNVSFEGLDFNNWGAGHPPDTVGDVGPNHYIQSINSSVAIYDKSTGARIAAFTLNNFMKQGNQGNLCDTNNFGDPVVLYDTFEDRWVITDFAFQLSGGNVVNPPGAFQCFAVSRTGDPVAGGWNFYSINTTGGLGDYPKLGVWPDGIYMTVNMFGYPAGAPFQGPRVFAFNKAQMYAGAPAAQSVTFDGPVGDNTILPGNARLQTGTPPPGTPNYFLSTSRFLNAVTVYKFKVDWEHPMTSTFTGPDVPVAASNWPNLSAASAPSLGGNNLEVLPTRAMMQNQYTNLGGAESLWAIHTVRRASTTGFAAPRFYQVPVTGGTVGPNITQAATFDPDGANVMHRFVPSLAVDRAGNMAFGYSTSSATTKPALKYAGRLATDPVNTFSQTEQTLIQGAGTQVGNCGGGPCTRWGDYAAMSLDPDGCTFWFTSMYYAADGLDHHTRVGSFSLPQCTTVGSGGVHGNVTSTSGGGPIAGAAVALGSRTTTTDAAGFYSFTNLPAGTYPSVTAGFPGYTSAGAASLVVNEGSVTVKDFALSPGADGACLTDTSRTDFQAGTPTNVDLAAGPGDATLLNPTPVDQQNTTLSNSGFNVTTTQWIGQSFMPAVSGALKKIDISLFCSGCTGTNPPVTIEVRTTGGGLPAATVLASTTVPGFALGSTAYYTATFASPPALTAGTTYALVARLTTPRAAGTGNYNVTASPATNPYTRGTLVFTTSGGASFGSQATTDIGFRTYMDTGYAPSGTLVSGLKDANPHAGGAVSWATLSWNASAPAGTSVKFKVAASNSPFGPFNFVGPDGTAATFFTTSGASLSQFNGRRYLKYQATLATTNPAVTPALNDVSLCFDNTVPTTLTVGSAAGTYGGTVNLSATLTDGVSPLAGRTVSFTLDGNGVGSAVTDAAGVASLANASLAGINAGSYPAGVGASFAATPNYLAGSATNALTVSPAGTSVAWGNPADLVYGTALGAAQLNATASVPGTFVYTPAAGTVLNAGNNRPLHVDFTPADAVNYTPSTADVTVNVLPAPLTVRADDKSRALGAPDPPFTATYTGFVNGDGPGSLSGALAFNTTATPASPVGNYPIIPSGVSSTNYQITFADGTLSVGFAVCVDYDQAHERQSGSTIPVRLRLCDASGANQSSSSVAVQAVSVVNAVTSAPQTLDAAGNANPGHYFRFDGGGYIYNLKTAGYPSGTYNLGFTAAGDPTPHAVQFVIK
ncbi:MAG TPA: MBG domain-containing protein [Pyrinomonadaceae bacterium]|jgi:hypothetical protein